MANFEVDEGCALSNSEGLQVLALAVAPDLGGLAEEHKRTYKYSSENSSSNLLFVKIIFQV